MIFWRARPRVSVEEDAPKRLQSNNVINFSDDDLQEIQTFHDDAVVVSAMIANYDVQRI